MASGVSVDVVAQKESKNVEDVDVKGEPEGEVEQDQVECCGSGASDGDVREEDLGQGTRRNEGVEDEGQDGPRHRPCHQEKEQQSRSFFDLCHREPFQRCRECRMPGRIPGMRATPGPRSHIARFILDGRGRKNQVLGHMVKRFSSLLQSGGRSVR